MNRDHVTADVETDEMGSASGGARAASRHRTTTCYVARVPLLEVMEDQIYYLISHGGKNCLPACADCARLEEAKRCLLRPFL